jgi:hypothetical protein
MVEINNVCLLYIKRFYKEKHYKTKYNHVSSFKNDNMILISRLSLLEYIRHAKHIIINSLLDPTFLLIRLVPVKLL